MAKFKHTTTQKLSAARIARGAHTAPAGKVARSKPAVDDDEDDEDDDDVPPARTVRQTPVAAKAPKGRTSKPAPVEADELEAEDLPPYVRGYAASILDNLKDVRGWTKARRAESPALAAADGYLLEAMKALQVVATEE